jgi:hypothetical protein
VAVKASSRRNTIGAAMNYPGNIIADNKGDGVALLASSTGNVLQGNIIGASTPDTTGKVTPLPNQGNGVHMDKGSLGNTVSTCLISYNAGAGIRDDNPALSNKFWQNSMTKDAQMGIDVAQQGVTNVALPALTLAQLGGDTVTVKGSISIPFQAGVNPQLYRVTIEFFSNTTPDNSPLAMGHGEGAVYVGSITVGFSANSNTQNFTATFSTNKNDFFGNPVTISQGNYVSATATLSTADGISVFGTGEFSKCVAVTASKDGVSNEATFGDRNEGGPHRPGD